mgnify:CR=1 FL=1
MKVAIFLSFFWKYYQNNPLLLLSIPPSPLLSSLPQISLSPQFTKPQSEWCWMPHDYHGYLPARLLATYGDGTMRCETEDGQVILFLDNPQNIVKSS